MTETAADAPATPTVAKTDSYAWYVLVILTIVYTFNFVDRQIIAIVSPAIKAELGLSDSMLGLLKGLAFAVLYTTLGIPIAWAADRFNRVSIITIALAVWSGFTALSGLAQSALHLTLARIGVGVGEAGGSPPSHSLIADYFPKEKRSTALSIYSLGIPFGQMFAFLAGGWVVQNLGWRSAFFIVGLPGILLAVLLKLTVREPVRGATDGGAGKISFKEGIAALVKIPSYWGIAVATALASFSGYGVGLWVVDFYKRTFDLSYTEITVPLGILNGLVYGVGTWAGGWLTDKFGKKDKRAYLVIPALGMLLTIPAGLLSTWASSPFWAFFWSAPFLFGLGIYLGPSFALIQTLAPVRLRAFAIAFMFLILNLFALGGAPSWVGWISDQFAKSYGEVIGLKLALTTLGVTSLAAAAAFFWTSRRLPADWAAAEARGRDSVKEH